MNFRRFRSLPLLLPSLLGLGICVSAPASADEQFVYWPLVTDGTEYRRVSYPREAGSLLVLADTKIVIEARNASVSYWPITREYLADFSGTAPAVDGVVEFVDEAGEVTVVEPEPYIVWHPEGVGAGPAELMHGDRVAAFYENYVQTARAAADRAKEYQRVVAEHQAAVDAWLKIAAQRPENLPPPPPEFAVKEPEPYRAYATEPMDAAVVSLPQGSYTVRIRGSDGAIVADTERALTSFGPVSQGIGYVVRPEDRWTQPSLSFAPGDTVYTTGKADLFLQPVPVAEYSARNFARLMQPQSIEIADPSVTVWVPGANDDEDKETVALAVWNGDAMETSLPTTPYRVAQRPGAAKGYVIEEFAPKQGSPLKPDFFAMRVGQGLAATRVSLLEGAGHDPARASDRDIRRVSPRETAWLFIPALLPLAFGLALRGASRWRRTPRGLSPARTQGPGL